MNDYYRYTAEQVLNVLKDHGMVKDQQVNRSTIETVARAMFDFHVQNNLSIEQKTGGTTTP